MAEAESAVTIDIHGLHGLVELLGREGYTVLGPTLRDGAVVPGRLTSVDDLPRGWGDTQEPGSYALRRRDDQALLGYAADAISWKSVLFPSRELIWKGGRTPDGSFSVQAGETPGDLGEPPYAILGIRSCDLHAVAIHDRVLRERSHPDLRYEARRKDAFLITVSCSDPSGTCFCVSMGTGPRADSGYDLALTELLGEEHTFLVHAGTERGAGVLAQIPSRPADSGAVRRADEVVERSTQQMGRSMDTTDIRTLLYENVDHPRWEDVASRCLSCGNCTMVCPTCFCTSVEEHTTLARDRTEHWRIWDSCFTSDFSYLHGGSVRSSAKSRYRQWMTHKLASWIDQFGTSGCVGCGRCLTWCPVGIDITEEVAAIRADPQPPTEHGGSR